MYIFAHKPSDTLLVRKPGHRKLRTGSSPASVALGAPESTNVSTTAAVGVANLGSSSSSCSHSGKKPCGMDIPATAGERPPTPTTHMRQLRASVTRPLEVNPCTEYHRPFWFPRSSLRCPPGKMQAKEMSRGPEAAEALRQGPKTWGLMMSDYGNAGLDVERGVTLQSELRRTSSEPSLDRETRPSKRQNPSMVSPGVMSCMVGGTQISLRHAVPPSMQRDEKRQIGLYEDSFKTWSGNYGPASNSLNTTDVTRVGEALHIQRHLLRP